MAKGVLIAAMDFSNVAEDEFNDWYDTEHIPERQRVPGFLICQRWIGVENPKQSVATYDLESLAGVAEPGLPGDRRREPVAVVEAGDRPRSAPAALRGRSDPARRQDGAGECRRVAAGRDDPGARGRDRVQRVVRQRARPRTRPRAGGAERPPLPDTAGGNPKYVALYHLASPGVVDSAEWKQASGSTPMPEHIRPQISDRLRFVCRSYRRAS